MRGEAGQGTVEYVGVLLVVAVLLGALVGAFGVRGVAADLAGSLVRAFPGALDLVSGDDESAETATASAAERALFASATDAGVPSDDRLSLRDVRLALIGAHGPGAGLQIYRTLVLESLRAAVPGLAGPRLFATAGPDLPLSRVAPSQQPISASHSLVRPSVGDAGEIEVATSSPSTHVVTVAEADEAARRLLAPGVSKIGIAADLLGMLPGVGTVTRGGHLALTAVRLFSIANSVAGAYAVGRDATALLSPGEAALPPGAREGDEIVSWTAVRHPSGGGPARTFDRTAVVRDGVLIGEGIARASEGS